MGASAGPRIDRENLVAYFTPNSTILNPILSESNDMTSKRTGADDRWMILTTANYLFAGFDDDSEIYANGVLKATINKQEISRVSLSANDIVSSNKPISFSREGSGQTGLCYAWGGTQFIHSVDRYNISFYFVATEKPANVTITDSRDLSTVYWSGVVSTDSYTTINVGTTNSQFIFESDQPIAVLAGELSSSDVLPLYPCSLEIFGTGSSSAHIMALKDNTTINEYSTDGSSRTYTLNRGGIYAGYSGGSQFTGNSVRITADKPISGESQADADGGEMTPYVGKDAFGTRFVIPEDEREFVKIVSDKPANITTYRQNGTVIGTYTLAGSSTNGVYNYRLTGESSYEGTLIVSDEPVYCIYEGEIDDETVLFASDSENTIPTGSIKTVFAPSLLKKFIPAAISNVIFEKLNDRFAAIFNGINTSVNLVETLNADTNNPLTAEAWFKLDDLSGEQCIISASSSSGDASNFKLTIDSSGNILVYHNSDGVSSTASIQPGIWYNITYTYDNNSGVGKLYLDSNEINSFTVPTGTPSSQTLEIGSSNGGQFFSGEIEKALIYSKFKSSSSVKRSYAVFRRRYK